MCLKTLTASLIWLVAALPVAAGAPTAAEILDRFTAAVGGAEAVERCAGLTVRGLVVVELSWQDPRRTETAFAARAGADGGLVYTEDGAPEEPSPKLRWILQPRFALSVEEHFPGLRYGGESLRDGRRCHLLLPEDLPPEHDGLYFDAETGLLVHVGYHDDVEGWRDVGGLLYPSRWVCGRKGGHATWRFEEVCTEAVGE